MTLQINDIAPDFSLPDQDNNLVHLADLKGKTVVLYFYPRDNTPGCTKEACGFRDRYAAFQTENIVILGISGDDAKAHGKFIKKFDLPFPLLSDIDHQVAIAYESYGMKKFMGKEYMGILRNTFVINPEGKIQKIYLSVKPEPHPEQVLKDLLSS
ncbi:Peroxiredoxin [Synechococcus sp. PCC 7502]|uniref:thioredoxin-dependent thiol peroxidase n=1 Tax=Synechococcus sp. PCC 7502 TaxID=1173263 RepID=UPI00029F9D39|nr:thioredoxin-dependent thiol peroxidase [Synechococcus sp. PCC 7502]AFY74481.1 Peroxiredoxin [Synechococcus sp. PCC 7502]